MSEGWRSKSPAKFHYSTFVKGDAMFCSLFSADDRKIPPPEGGGMEGSQAVGIVLVLDAQELFLLGALVGDGLYGSFEESIAV